jgi:E3 ubiquitin-protein ligase TRIP12
VKVFQTLLPPLQRCRFAKPSSETGRAWFARYRRASFNPITPSAGNTGRASRKSSKTKAPSMTSAPQSSSSNTKDKTGTTRRSSRRQQSQSQAPAPPPAPDTEELQHPLECPDEQQLTDDDDHLDDGSALDAIVDDLEDGMDRETLPDPSAVNMEVASTGKVTARKEDGTRVATPSQSSTSVSRIPPSMQNAASSAANGTAILKSADVLCCSHSSDSTGLAHRI